MEGATTTEFNDQNVDFPKEFIEKNLQIPSSLVNNINNYSPGTFWNCKLKLNKINPSNFSNNHHCCEHLDEFCQTVELKPNRTIRVCVIPGNIKLSSADLKCYENDDVKTINESIKSNNDSSKTKNDSSKANIDYIKANNDNIETNNDNIKTENDIIKTNVDEITANENDIIQNTNVKVDLKQNDLSGNASNSLALENLTIEPENVLLFHKVSKQLIEQTAIFMIHGVGGEFKVWSPQIIFFNSLGFTIVALDMIGHGKSSAPSDKEEYHFDKMAGDVIKIFEKYKMPRNIVMGHSYGSCFAAVIANYRPNSVHCLVMISGGGPIPLGPQLGIFCLPLPFLICIKWLLYREFLRRSFHKPNQASVCKFAAVTVPVHVLKYTINGQRWEDGGVDFYSSISLPTLLIHGKKDRLISIGEVRFMAATIRGSSLAVLEDAGHMVMLESPDPVNDVILTFVRDNLI